MNITAQDDKEKGVAFSQIILNIFIYGEAASNIKNLIEVSLVENVLTHPALHAHLDKLISEITEMTKSVHSPAYQGVLSGVYDLAEKENYLGDEVVRSYADFAAGQGIEHLLEPKAGEFIVSFLKFFNINKENKDGALVRDDIKELVKMFGTIENKCKAFLNLFCKEVVVDGVTKNFFEHFTADKVKAIIA